MSITPSLKTIATHLLSTNNRDINKMKRRSIHINLNYAFQLLGITFLTISLLLCGNAYGGKAPNVSIGPDNRLVYQASERGDRIPDFSHCGYKNNEKPIPNVPVQIFFSPTKGDNTNRIQSAIDYVSKLPQDKNGFRGIVLLLEGRYFVYGGLKINGFFRLPFKPCVIRSTKVK